MHHEQIKQIEELIAQLKVPESATVYLSVRLYYCEEDTREPILFSLYIWTVQEQTFGEFLTIVAEPFNLFIKTLKQTIQEQKE